MPKPTVFRAHSFAGGILSRSLDSRADIERYGISARVLHNVQVMRNGSACNRSGFEHLGPVKAGHGAVRLIEWIRDDDDRYVIEMGDNYMRLWTDGGRIITSPMAITEVWAPEKQYNPGDLVTSTATAPPGTISVYYAIVANIGVVPGPPGTWLEFEQVVNIASVLATGVFEIPTPYDESDLFDIQFRQQGDVVWLTHPDYAPHQLSRAGTTSWTMLPMRFRPPLRGPLNLASTSTGTAISDEYKITAVKRSTFEQSLPGCIADTTASTSAITGGTTVDVKINSTGHAIANGSTILCVDVYPSTGTKNPAFEARLLNHTFVTTNTVAGVSFDLDGTADIVVPGGYLATFVVPNVALGILSGTTNGLVTEDAKITTGTHGLVTGDEVLILYATAGTTAEAFEAIVGNTYTVTVVDSTHFTLDASDGIAWGADVATIYLSRTGLVDTHTASVPVTLTWDLVAGAEKYYIYKKFNGVFGYLATSTEGTFIDTSTATAGAGADTSDTPPHFYNEFRGAGKFPAIVGMHDQRLCFGATNDKPSDFWISKAGDFLNFTHSSPFKDDDAINGTIIGAQELRAFVDLDKLVAVSNVGLYFIESDESGLLVPEGISARRRGSVGSSRVSPLVVDDSVLFVQNRNGLLRDFRLDAIEFQKGRDLTVFARSLFDGFEIVDRAHQSIPESTIWWVRADGILVGHTYVREQEINAFHTHDSGRSGLIVGGDPVQDVGFESVAVIPEGGEDSLYAVVNRTIEPEYDHAAIYEPPAGFMLSALGHHPSQNDALCALFGDEEIMGSDADVSGGSGVNLVVTSAAHGLVNGDVIVGVQAYREDATQVAQAFFGAIVGGTFTVASATTDTFALSGTTGIATPTDTRISFVKHTAFRKNVPAMSGQNLNVGWNGHGDQMPSYPGGQPGNAGWYIGTSSADVQAVFAQAEALGCIPNLGITMVDSNTNPLEGADEILAEGNNASYWAPTDPTKPPYLDIHDQYLGMLEQCAQVGNAIGTYNKPVFIVIGPEANGGEFGYHRVNFADGFAVARAAIRVAALAVNGASWGKVATCFVLEASSSSTDYESWYPGNTLVNWGGVDIFNAITNLTPGQTTYARLLDVLNFFRSKGKPVILNECGAVGLGVTADNTILPDAENGGDDADAEDNARQAWNNWFRRFFEFLDENADIIKCWRYVEKEHTFTVYSGPPLFWKNARLSLNKFLRARYIAQIREGRYLGSDQRSLLKSWRVNMGLSAEPEGPTETRTIERMRPRKAGQDDHDERLDSFFVDSGATWDGRNEVGSSMSAHVLTTLTLSAGTTYEAGTQATMTASVALFAAGDVDHVWYRLVDPVNGDEVEVMIVAYTSTTVVTVEFREDCTAALQAQAAADWTKMVDSIAGLERLEGRILNVLADGVRVPTVAVAGETITLQAPAGIIHYGLPIAATIETLDFDAPDSGIAGQAARAPQMVAVVHNTRGAVAGPATGDDLFPLEPTPVDDGSETSLFTGKAKVAMQSDSSLQTSIRIRMTDPYPMLIEGIIPVAEVSGV